MQCYDMFFLHFSTCIFIVTSIQYNTNNTLLTSSLLILFLFLNMEGDDVEIECIYFYYEIGKSKAAYSCKEVVHLILPSSISNMTKLLTCVR